MDCSSCMPEYLYVAFFLIKLECGNSFNSLEINDLTAFSNLLSLQTSMKVNIAGTMTIIATMVAIRAVRFLRLEFAYLSIGKPKIFTTRKVANTMKIVLMVKRYMAFKK